MSYIQLLFWVFTIFLSTTLVFLLLSLRFPKAILFAAVYWIFYGYLAAKIISEALK